MLCITFTSITFMMYYMITTTYSRTYTIQYGFDSGTVGLCFLPVAAGAIVGSNVGGRFADRTYNMRVSAAKGENLYPEMRISLEAVGLAVFIQMCGFISYGWCIQFNMHMAGGLVSMFFGT